MTGVYDITEDGVYKFYGVGASPVAIRVADNVVCTNVLGDASINVNGGSVAPLELGAGSRVSLQLMGANTMNRIGGPGSYAVIRVPDGAALTIADGAEEGEATGSLTIDETNLDVVHVVGIGEAGIDSQMGSLTIDSGEVTIRMRHDNNIHGGAAIGSARCGSSCGDVTINGGKVVLDGPGLGPAIGAGTDNTRMGHGGNVTINGGWVDVKGYGGASAIGLAPTYGSGAVGTPGTFTMNGGVLYARAYKGGSYSFGQCGAAIGGSGTRNGTTGSTIGQVTFNGGHAYLYSEGAYSIGCGKPQNGSGPVARAATDRVTITGGNVWAHQGIQGEVVNTAGNKVTEVKVPPSLFPTDPYTIDLGGSVSFTFPKNFFGDNLQHLYLPSGVYELFRRQPSTSLSAVWSLRARGKSRDRGRQCGRRAAAFVHDDERCDQGLCGWHDDALVLVGAFGRGRDRVGRWLGDDIQRAQSHFGFGQWLQRHCRRTGQCNGKGYSQGGEFAAASGRQ